MSDQKLCDILYDLHTTSPMVQTEDERLGKVLDTNYTQVDIDHIVDDLDIAKATKQKLKQTLKKYPILFGGGLGTLDMRPMDIELKPDTKSYGSKFYNVSETYDRMAKIGVNCLCTFNVLEKLSHTINSPWAAPSFCQLKKTGDPCLLTDFREVKNVYKGNHFNYLE